MWNFRERIRKGMEFTRVIKKKPGVQGSSFLVLGFSSGVAHYYGITLAMTLDFPGISKINLEMLVEYLQRHFLNHCLFFFLEHTTDRQIDLLLWALRYPIHCTLLEHFPQPPQNKICYRLHPKYTPFSCFPVI